MKEKNVVLFTDKEEELLNFLIGIGIRKTVAYLLIYLTDTPESTSRDLERGTDLRQPEVSLTMKYLADQGWIKYRPIPSEKKGRPQKMYSLAVPVRKIISGIEKTREDEANHQLALVKKIREYI